VEKLEMLISERDELIKELDVLILELENLKSVNIEDMSNEEIEKLARYCYIVELSIGSVVCRHSKLNEEIETEIKDADDR
jgi:hypothetical protein